MKMKYIAALGFMVSLPSFAVEPQICPAVDAIKSIGVSPLCVQQADKTWVTGRRNQKYNTNSHWTFIMGHIKASSVSEAYYKASQSLNSLAFQLGPVQGPLGKWLCYYNTNQGYTIVTVNPPIATNTRHRFL